MYVDVLEPSIALFIVDEVLCSSLFGGKQRFELFGIPYITSSLGTREPNI